MEQEGGERTLDFAPKNWPLKMIGGEIGGYHRAEQAQCLMKAAEEDIKFIRPI